VDNKIIIGL